VIHCHGDDAPIQKQCRKNPGCCNQREYPEGFLSLSAIIGLYKKAWRKAQEQVEFSLDGG